MRDLAASGLYRVIVSEAEKTKDEQRNSMLKDLNKVSVSANEDTANFYHDLAAEKEKLPGDCPLVS